MLYYSDEMRKKIDKLIPNIVLTDDFKIVGSFGRSKYVTDVDIINKVERDDYNKDLTEIINKLPKELKFVNVVCGSSFEYPWKIINEKEILNYDQINAINFFNDLFFKKIITEKERDYCNHKLSKTPLINNLLLIEDKLRYKHKLRYGEKDILNGVKVSANVVVVHYMLDKELPIDVTFKSEPEEKLFDRNEYLMFLKKEYYYILMSIRRKLLSDQKEVQYLLFNKYGFYKQILMNVFYLAMFVKFNVYSPEEIYEIRDKISKKISSMTNVNVTKLNELNDMDSDLWWDELMNIEDNINREMNGKVEHLARKYYSLVQHKYAKLAF